MIPNDPALSPATACAVSAEADAGRIFDIQRMSIHDGPGTRTSVFFKGCPLHCTWCQNPEGISSYPDLLVDKNRCIGCGQCTTVCPVISTDDESGTAQQCVICGRCADVCPAGARYLAGQRMSVSEIVQAVQRDQAFYGTQGGATFGGGEPLWQWPFLRDCLDRLGELGIHTALDTCAYTEESVIAEVAPRVNLIMADLKIVDRDKHARWTGVSNDPILKAIRFWNRNCPDKLWISLPLVPGIHWAEELLEVRAFLLSLENPVKIRLVPYHSVGSIKYEQLGRQPPDFDSDAVDYIFEQARNALNDERIEFLPEP